MTKEYFDKISQKTSLPDNFDINDLLNGLRMSENSQFSSDKKLTNFAIRYIINKFLTGKYY